MLKLPTQPWDLPRFRLHYLAHSGTMQLFPNHPF